ncbi:hypothetical protein [uncultured Tenacibaculum sp.]|uniref:hypothetical protein n=1 Tax=uncultured Tenacibaculum sp. TaxID=174713 RepID=UPI0026032F3A|nr:hypothetical protein [uncultured Tenacibaculum sp.]
MTEITNFNFYKELHLSELKRKNDIDSLVGYPTTLITILIGSAFYFFKSENFTYKSTDNSFLIFLLILIVCLFGTSIVVAIVFLIKMYLNTFKKYKYLPSPLTLKKREKELYEHYEGFYLETESKESYKKAIEYADNEFKKDLLNYYIDYGTNNQIVNDNRTKDYYSSRKCLTFAIFLLSLIGILILIK